MDYLCYTFSMGVFTLHFLKRVLLAGVIVLGYLSISATVFHRLEHWTWPQAFYFSAVTLTSVGYGDLHPTSDTSRLVATAFVLISVPMFFLLLGVIGEAAYMHYRRSAHHVMNCDNHHLPPVKKRKRRKFP